MNRKTVKCRCRHDETCGAEFESYHAPGEMTCCPECGRQQSPLEIKNEEVLLEDLRHLP
jgi:hypothetical protein